MAGEHVDGVAVNERVAVLLVRVVLVLEGPEVGDLAEATVLAELEQRAVERGDRILRD